MNLPENMNTSDLLCAIEMLAKKQDKIYFCIQSTKSDEPEQNLKLLIEY